MKITTTKIRDYLVWMELRGYDARDRPCHKLRVLTLPERLTNKTLAAVLCRLTPSYIEAISIVTALSREDALKGAQFLFLDDDCVKPEKSCPN